MPQFTEEEAQRIFARAAERQHAANDAAPGFSLDELTEIGRAAGLSPEHIAAAVAEIRTRAPAVETGRTVMGVQTDVRRSRVVAGELTDEVWEGVVSRLRRTFKTKGITADVGRTREWTGTNSTGGLSNLHVIAEPVHGGTKVTLETSRTDEAQQIKYLPVFIVLITALFPVLGFASGKAGDPVLWVFSALFAVIGLIALFGSRKGYKTWSERRQGEFDSLLDQVELMVLNDTRPDTTASSAPSLGQALDKMAEAPDADVDATPSRTRA